MDRIAFSVNCIVIVFLHGMVHGEEWIERDHSGYEFAFSTNEKSWFDANVTCQLSHAFLAGVHSQDEHEWIKSKRSNDEYWIGYRNPAAGRGDRWSWSDGSLHNYTAWTTRIALADEPNDMGDICAYYGKTAHKNWYDTSCSDTKRYICKRDIDDCETNMCANNSNCVDGTDRYVCNCTPGFEGEHCDQDIDDCKNNSCANNSTCVDGIDRYMCNCTPGFEGAHCEQDINECTSNPCGSNAACIEKIGNYTCKCSQGYEGRHCLQEIDECLSSPCQNNGQCINGIAEFTCTCQGGYGGERCENKTALSSNNSMSGSRSLKMLVIGCISAFLSIIAVVVITTILVKRYRKKGASSNREIGHTSGFHSLTREGSRQNCPREESQIMFTDNEMYSSSPTSSLNRYPVEGVLYTVPNKPYPKRSLLKDQQYHGESSMSDMYSKEQPVFISEREGIETYSEQAGINDVPGIDSPYSSVQPRANRYFPINDSLYSMEHPTTSPPLDADGEERLQKRIKQSQAQTGTHVTQ